MNKKILRTFVMIGTLGVVFAIIFFVRLQSTQSGYNAYAAPRVFPQVSPMPAENLTEGCVPFPASSSKPHEQTATPDRKAGAKVPHHPTATPYPAARVFDLSPQLPEGQKSTVLVYRCDGSFDRYLAGPEVPMPQALQLGPGDRIVHTIQPAVLMGSKPVVEPTVGVAYPPPPRPDPEYPYP